jgi:hypothetical protein
VWAKGLRRFDLKWVPPGGVPNACPSRWFPWVVPNWGPRTGVPQGVTKDAPPRGPPKEILRKFP